MNHADVERLLFRAMETSVIRSLLAGNDTMCFTTQQYVAARDRWIAEATGSTREQLGLDLPSNEINRRQLSGSSLVKEVGPNVWAAVPDVLSQITGE